MIKAFLFDYDGVVTAGVDDDAVPGRLASNVGVSEEVATAWIKSIWAPLLRGELTTDQVWQIIEEQYGQPIAPEHRDIWFTWDVLTPLPEMLELVRDLKSKGYPVGILSNVTADTLQIIRANGGYDAFDFTVLSTEVGYKKPEPEIFKIALSKLDGIRPDEVLFLDDREHAVTAARELGIKTLHVTDHAQAIAQVRTLL